MCSVSGQYKAALEGRREDSSRFWTVFGVMSAINGAMLVLLDKESLIPPLHMSFLGAILCVVWLSLQLRLAAWVKWWEEKLVNLETHIAENARLFTNRELDSKNPLKVGFSTRTGGVLLTILFGIAWIWVGKNA